MSITEFHAERLRTPLSIAFAFVATHNHFVLDRGGKVFKQSAPIIKLPADATEDDHLALLGLLNSSTACFWMKQVVARQGQTEVSAVALQDEAWEKFYEYHGTKLDDFPVLDTRAETLPLARELDALARRCVELSPAELVKREVPTGPALEAARQRDGAAPGPHGRLAGGTRLALLPALRADWRRSIDRLDVARRAVPRPPGLKLGERAFEIAMARQMAAGELQTAWFERHGSTPITEIPAHWPEAYRRSCSGGSTRSATTRTSP